jgi:glucose dehydrogenase
MHRSMVGALAVTAACAVVSATGVSDASASRGLVPTMVTAQEARGRPQPPSSPGTQLWAAHYSGPRGGWANSLVVSPGGGTVFVTGSSTGDYATVAYSAVTGARLWAERYHGFGQNTATMNVANSVAVSPGGGTVFVTGSSARYGATAPQYYATVAYSAATGAQLWAARYRGPGNGTDIAYSVAVSPSGGTVFVTGSSAKSITTSPRYSATVAYSG